LRIMADLFTGPQEQIIASKTAQEVFDSATKVNLQWVSVSDAGSSYQGKIQLIEDKDSGVLYDQVNPDKFRNVRRFLWDAQIPTGSSLTMLVRTSANGQDWGDWSITSASDSVKSVNIGESISSVEYIAYLAREEVQYPVGDIKSLLSPMGIELNLEDYGLTEEDLKAAINKSESKGSEYYQAEKSDEKRLVAHLFVNGQDCGRYLGAVVDVSGRFSDIFYPIILAGDPAVGEEGPIAYVGERYFRPQERFASGDSSSNTETYKSIVPVKWMQDNVEVKFVDSDGNAEGDAHLTVNGEDKGKFISSIFSVSSTFANSFNGIWITGKSDDHEADAWVGDTVRVPRRQALLYQARHERGAVNPSQENTDRYKAIEGFSDFQKSVRMKFVPYDQNLELAEDSNGENEDANLLVNNKDQGDFVGCGVEVSGAMSDLFHPIWISANDAWVGEMEKVVHIFYARGNYYGGQTNIERLTNQTSARNSERFSQLNSVKILRGRGNLQQAQRINICIDVKSRGGDEPTPTPTPTEVESPSLYEIGLSAGYSADEPENGTGGTSETPASRVVPASIPGWLKGGLLKTGTDLLVLIVITVVIVIAIIYLLSLLKEKEGLDQQDQVNQGKSREEKR